MAHYVEISALPPVVFSADHVQVLEQDICCPYLQEAARLSSVTLLPIRGLVRFLHGTPVPFSLKDPYDAWWEEEHLILCTLAGPSSFPASKDASWPRGAPWDHCSVMVADHSISAGFGGTVLSSCPSHMDVTGLGG